MPHAHDVCPNITDILSPVYIYYTIHICHPSAYAHFKRGKKIYLRLKSTGPRVNSDAYHIKGKMYTHTEYVHLNTQYTMK